MGFDPETRATASSSAEGRERGSYMYIAIALHNVRSRSVAGRRIDPAVQSGP